MGCGESGWSWYAPTSGVSEQSPFANAAGNATKQNAKPIPNSNLLITLYPRYNFLAYQVNTYKDLTKGFCKYYNSIVSDNKNKNWLDLQKIMWETL